MGMCHNPIQNRCLDAWVVARYNNLPSPLLYASPYSYRKMVWVRVAFGIERKLEESVIGGAHPQLGYIVITYSEVFSLSPQIHLALRAYRL